MDEDWDIKPVIFAIIILIGLLWLSYESIQWVLG